MSSMIRYISTKEKLIAAAEDLLNDNPKPDIMISGVWSKSLHESIVRLILNNQCSSSCRVIIPKLLFKGDMSLTLIRDLCKAGGQVRVNNSITNNLLLIDRYLFILSFSSRLNSLSMLNTSFECAVMTDDKEIVSDLRTQLQDIFDNSVLFRM